MLGSKPRVWGCMLHESSTTEQRPQPTGVMLTHIAVLPDFYNTEKTLDG